MQRGAAQTAARRRTRLQWSLPHLQLGQPRQTAPVTQLRPCLQQQTLLQHNLQQCHPKAGARQAQVRSPATGLKAKPRVAAEAEPKAASRPEPQTAPKAPTPKPASAAAKAQQRRSAPAGSSRQSQRGHHNGPLDATAPVFEPAMGRPAGSGCKPKPLNLSAVPAAGMPLNAQSLKASAAAAAKAADRHGSVRNPGKAVSGSKPGTAR